MSDPVTYVIGDVHGEAERLVQLHRLIFERLQMHITGTFGDGSLEQFIHHISGADGQNSRRPVEHSLELSQV